MSGRRGDGLLLFFLASGLSSWKRRHEDWELWRRCAMVGRLWVRWHVGTSPGRSRRGLRSRWQGSVLQHLPAVTDALVHPIYEQNPAYREVNCRRRLRAGVTLPGPA